jgi:hypothetical protein
LWIFAMKAVPCFQQALDAAPGLGGGLLLVSPRR